MTPLICAVMRNISIEDTKFDPTELSWFDITGVDRNKELTKGEFNILATHPPPFEKSIVVWAGMTSRGPIETFLLVVGNNPEEGIAVTQWAGPAGKKPKRGALFYYLVEDGELKYSIAEGEKQRYEEEHLIALEYTAFWLKALCEKTTAYRPVVKPTFTNKRRTAKGKAPLYDWTTVIVDPIKPIPQPPKGGSHASPRQHDVRGHQVRSKLGKVFWRKPHKRGDPSKGVIFHDYKVKGIDDGRQAQ